MKDIVEISYKKNVDDITYTHYHNENEIILVTEGASEFIINSKKYILKKN